VRALVPVLLGVVVAVVGSGPRLARADGVAQRPLDVRPLLPAATVRALAQAPDGHLWLATRDGLLRHDGLAATEIPLPHAEPHALLAARDGAVWVGFGGIEERRWPLPAGAPRGGPGLVRVDADGARALAPFAAERVWALAEGPDGAIWVGTETGLARLVGDAASWVLRGRPILALAADERGVFAGTGGALLHVPGGAAAAREWPLVGGVLALLRDRAGTLWVGTGRALLRLDPDGAGPAPAGIDVEAPVRALAEDRGGGLWLAGTSALARLERGQVTRFGPREGVSDPKILALAADRDGGVFAGARAGGATRIAPAQVWNLGAAEGLAGEMAFAVLAARDGRVFVTATAGVTVWDRGRVTSYRYDAGEAPFGLLRAIAQDARGEIWFGAGRPNLVRFAGGRFLPVPLEGAPPDAAVHAIAAGPDGALWISFSKGGLARSAPDAPTRLEAMLGPAEGLCPGPIESLAFAADGTVWAGSRTGGLARVQAGRARCLGRREGLPTERISALLVDRRGDLWGGGHHAPGLFRLRGGDAGATEILSRPAGLDFGAYAIVEGRDGDLWVPSGEGIFRIPRAPLDARAPGGRVEQARIGVAAGIRSAECTEGFLPAAARTADGRLWVPTLLGVAVVAEGAATRPAAPRPVLEAVRVDGAPARLHGPLSLPTTTRVVDVAFTAPTFTGAEALAFEYRLEGLSAAWLPAGGRRTVSLGPLAPGAYRFAVRLAGADAGTEATLAFRIAPPFYRRAPFLGAVGLVVALGAVGAHRLRLRRVRARFAAVEAERARIARDLHDDLAQSFTAIGYHLDALKNVVGDADPAGAIVEQARKLVDASQTQTRQTIWNLRAEASGGDLVARLRAIAGEAAGPGAPRIEVEAARLPALPPLVAHEAALVAREAVTNALRHAGARRIRIEAAVKEGGVRVVVRDDGSGLAPDAAKKGFGLLGMRERAARLGGTLTIGPDEHGGTAVTLAVPTSAQQATAEKETTR
jgi:signal transduction histidine kinase/ligand-binding sensor domain-containing protein